MGVSNRVTIFAHRSDVIIDFIGEEMNDKFILKIQRTGENGYEEKTFSFDRVGAKCARQALRNAASYVRLGAYKLAELQLKSYDKRGGYHIETCGSATKFDGKFRLLGPFGGAPNLNVWQGIQE